MGAARACRNFSVTAAVLNLRGISLSEYQMYLFDQEVLRVQSDPRADTEFCADRDSSYRVSFVRRSGTADHRRAGAEHAAGLGDWSKTMHRKTHRAA